MQRKNFKVNEVIYPQEALETASADFSEVAKIEYQNGEIIIEHENESEIDSIFNEFMNYALSVTTELNS